MAFSIQGMKAFQLGELDLEEDKLGNENGFHQRGWGWAKAVSGITLA